MKTPLVSILIISYNQEDLIRETVESCLRQTYENLQIVVSDDGSKDGTQAILRQLRQANPERIKLILNSSNSGITANCNIGLTACDGELVALMGGDDVLLPKKVEFQVSAFLADPDLVLSYHPCHVSYADRMIDQVGHRNKDRVDGLIEMIGKFEAQLPGPATMVRTSAIPSWGFDDSIATASDWMFFIDVSSMGRVARIEETLAIYRQHDSNIGHRYFEYSDDFLRTLHVASQRYGHIEGVPAAVRRGGRRFLLGVIYRSLEHNEPHRARLYVRQLRQYEGAVFCALLFAITFLPGLGLIFRHAKSILKRYV